jgi:L-fuconolactonase
MTEQTILDAHVHLWNPERLPIPWLESVPSINRHYGLADYLAATDGLPVEGLVYLQVEVARPYSLIEASDIVALAANNKIIDAIVPWAPLEDGSHLRAYLEQLVLISSKIRGVRRITQDEPDPELCLQPGFLEGTRLLAEFGLTCDLCCRYIQLGPTVELVRRVPETNFILDHIAKPDIVEGQWQPWADQITELARLPNIVCKVSGVATEADHGSWTIDNIKRYVFHVFEQFGEDRIVFGSDWPVATQATTYRRWVETLQTLTQDFSSEAKRKFWRDNGRHFYRLPV